MATAAAAKTPFWRGVFRFEKAKVVPWIALRNGAGVALPLAVGMAVGHATSGLIATTGALNVAFSDGSDPYPHRLRRMLCASLFCALAVVAGGLSGRDHALTVLLTGFCAFAAGMMVAMGTAATDIANVTLVTLVVFSAQSMTVDEALTSGLAALAGGLLQTGLALALWPIRRYGPERRTLARLYFELSRTAALGARAAEAPLASAEATQAHDALSTLAGDHSLEGERCLALLSQAERIRLSLLTLSRLRLRLGREDGRQEQTAIVDRTLELSGRMLDCAAELLLERVCDRPHTEEYDELRAISETLRQTEPGTVQEARRQLDALTGQLRSALELAAHVTTAGSTQFERHEAARPWTLRLSGLVAVVRANLNLQSAVFRHALRLAACVAIGEIVGHAVGWRRTYWMPMTAAIVLRPDFTTTFSRGVLRVAGTLVGLGLATALFHMLIPTGPMEVVLIAVFAFLLRCFGPANYGIFAATLSAVVVLMFAATGVEPGPVILARALNTIAGGAIALAGYQLWPTWERTQVPEALARMLDAYRRYFQTVRDAYLFPEQSFAGELDRTRQASRLARSNAEASLARLAAEPGISLDRLGALNSVLANSHRFIHAAMSLEGGLIHGRPVPVRDAFRVFSNHVDVTLYFLTAALRGSRIAAADLPDLREDHNALLHSGDPHEARYALSNVEGDRITNTLNTLAGEVFTLYGKS